MAEILDRVDYPISEYERSVLLDVTLEELEEAEAKAESRGIGKRVIYQGWEDPDGDCEYIIWVNFAQEKQRQHRGTQERPLTVWFKEA